jgi:hypothetical protein
MFCDGEEWCLGGFFGYERQVDVFWGGRTVGRRRWP